MVATVAFDPGEFLRLAEELASNDPSEASLRTAVGRVYYSVFLTMREALEVPGRSRIHSRVIGELRRRDLYAGGQLAKLEGLRAAADYELEVEDPLRRDWRRNYRVARQLAGFILARVS